jgi:hypothetical protein
MNGATSLTTGSGTRRWSGLGLGLVLTACLLLGGEAPAQDPRHDFLRRQMQPATRPVVTPNPLRRPEVLDTPQLPPPRRPGLSPAPTTPATGETPPAPDPVPEPNQPPPKPAAAGEPDSDPDKVTFRADQLSQEDGETTLTGNVEVRASELSIRSRRATLDRDNIWGTFRDDVELEGEFYRARTPELSINLDTEEWKLLRGWVKVEPDFFENEEVLEPLFLRAATVGGSPDLIEARQGIGSSCDRETDRHWEMRSNRIRMAPDQWVIFERPTLYMFGRRIIRYPWDLRLSLTRKENRFLPEFGQNEVEGYYLKVAYAYALNEINSGFVRLHLTQLRGTGIGIDHLLDSTRQLAEISLFTEPSRGSLSGRLRHQMQFNSDYSSNFNLNLQRDSGYGLGTESLSSNLTLRHDTRQANSLLGFQQAITSTSLATSRRFTTNLTHRQRVGTNEQWSMRTVMRRSSFRADQAPDEELDAELQWQKQLRTFDLNFMSQKRYDLDGSKYTADSSFYVLNRVPDLVLTSDSRRLGDFRILGSSMRAKLHLGRFEQRPTILDLYRGGLDIELPGHTKELSLRRNSRTSGRFRQFFYSDGSAQWIGDVRSEYTQKLSSSWETRASFIYGKPNGFSPMRMDYASPSSVAYLQAVRLVPEKMRLELSTGHDFRNNYTHDAIFRSELMLSPSNRLELQSGYSIELSEWRPLNVRWLFARQQQWYSAVTVNYDLTKSELSNVSFDMDWTVNDLWRVQFLGGYSNYGGFDQADIQILRDLHCMVASFVYRKSTGEFRIGLGIKAFPADSRTFGVGDRGQYFESNFGDSY